MFNIRSSKVSVLVPAFNEEDNVCRAHQAISDVFRRLPAYDYELIFTDNHSTDRTFERLTQIARADPKVTVIRFSRNVGYQRSVLAAYKAASGDCSVQIDCDLQDPPELIPDMLALWRAGNQVVYGVRRSLPDRWAVAFARRTFYRLLGALSEDDLPINAGEFRLVDRRILDELRRVEDASPYVRGLISAMGFRQVGLEYDRQDRIAGDSKFPFRSMLALAVDAVLNHSLLPLRLASYTSLIAGAGMLILLFSYMVGYLFLGQGWPRGFATTTALLLFSIALNALFLGILGEYIGRIFMQQKLRPPVIVEEIVSIERSRTRLQSGRELVEC